MIQSFRDQGTWDVFDRKNSKRAAKVCPADSWSVARRKLDQLNQAEVLEDLRVPPGNRLEALKGDRKGQHSIRINDQFRVCFRWTRVGPEDVEIVDYHD
jgi:proteic killer suppression protein